eukprot:TRINITY_DN62540_c0_g1_i1.p1 TRINITY_DN62540_c0_g1~~TRINITY_DN62540_c0_g1_i1.p1  ORF type:complete len:1571 (+),score=373.03 TRINITY_DN62540_c0_g1_i1:53-4765(+)
MTNWVNAKEEWLLDWSDARCLKEITFEHAAGAAGHAATAKTDAPSADAQDVFFSDVIEAGNRCLACRACGDLVDIFDISPLAECFASWRVRLPSPIVSDIGISHVSSADGSRCHLMFLTKAHEVHRVQINFQGSLPEVNAMGSTLCQLTSPASAFCALDADLVAIGCFNGSLQGVKLGTGRSYEFSQGPWLQRLTGGLVGPTPPLVLALASATTARSGPRLLAFSADGQLRLWTAQDNGAKLVAAQSLDESEQGASLVGTSFAYMRVSPCRSRACLVLKSALYVADLPAPGWGGGSSITLKTVEPPFADAVPSLVSLSHGTLWSNWSGASREQMFMLDLEAPDTPSWQARALDACQLPREAAMSDPGLCTLAVEGCPTLAAAGPAQRPVFTLYHQHEVWRAEEDGFDILHFAETLETQRRQSEAAPAARSPFHESFESDGSVEERTLAWWLGRVFLPGRYSASVITTAMEDMGARAPTDTNSAGQIMPATWQKHHVLKSAVEQHLRRLAVSHGARLQDAGRGQQAAAAMLTAMSLAAAASEFLRACDSAWRRRHQVCGIAASASWAPHAWYPAGSQPVSPGAAVEAGATACPLIFCFGGLCCLRPVHGWTERWWTTFHLMRDLSNYEKMELDNVLEISLLDEWKLCASAWFLAQCVGNSNVNMTLGLLQRGASAAAAVARFVEDVPKHLAAHITRCAKGIKKAEATQEVVNISQAVRASSCPEHRHVRIFDTVLDTLRGTWLDQSGSVLEAVGGHSTGRVLLTDILRGSIAMSESEYVGTAMRDLLLLCGYVNKAAATNAVPAFGRPAAEPDWPLQADPAKWSALQKLLDEQLPLSLSLQQSLQQQAASPQLQTGGIPWAPGVLTDAMPARAADFWAAAYRASVNGRQQLACVRVPVASIKDVQYAMMLLRHESWHALRWWSRQQPLTTTDAGVDKPTAIASFIAYVHACELLANRRFQEAAAAFLAAEGCAPLVAECLPSAVAASVQRVDIPAVITYYNHVASLFGTRGRPEDEYKFAHKAATYAEEAFKDARPLQQQLWSSAFEKAVRLDMWQEARDALLKIDAFENHVRLLGQRLRARGNVELMMQLPDKYRLFFLSSLHEHASMTAPTPGSDALMCYNLLYALHFADQEYLKAASVAHMLYAALVQSLQHFVPADAKAVDAAAARVRAPIWRTGDCLSKAQDVPKIAGGYDGEVTDMDCDSAQAPQAFSAFAKALDNVWPLLEQQRNALLMATAALSLTKEKVLVVPPPAAVADNTKAGTDDLDDMRAWFDTAEQTCNDCVFTLKDAERLLTTVEAQMVLSGRSDLRAPADLAGCVAGLGLLALALQICAAHSLDAWQFALQPFARLCVASESDADEKVAALVDAARGPPQAHMFVRSDGCEPLGTDGSKRKALWRALEEGLAQTARRQQGAGLGPSAPLLSADSARLYSLVAEEILSGRQSDEALPEFLVAAMSAGPSWVSLLRLFMKHGRIEETIVLLTSQLERCGPPSVSAAARGAGGGALAWSPLDDFPLSLVGQLRTAVNQKAELERPKGETNRQLGRLDAVLSQFRKLIVEVGRSNSRRR